MWRISTTACVLRWAVLSFCLSSCATANKNGRTQWIAPGQVSNLYSTVDMRLQMLTVANAQSPSPTTQCTLAQAFDQQVQRLGAQLARSAFELYPDLKGRVTSFNFSVVDKAQLGTTSDSTGSVLIFSHTGRLQLSDDSVAFMLAREMGRVIWQHHDEDTATSISFSILAKFLLFPASAIYSTVASFAGARAVTASYRSDQLREADTVALALLAKQDWNAQGIAVTLDQSLTASSGAREITYSDQRWVNDMNASVAWAEQLAGGLSKPVALSSAGSEPLPPVAQLAELDGIPPVAESAVVEHLPSVLSAAASPTSVASVVDFSAVVKSVSMAQTSLANATASTPALARSPELATTQAGANPIERPAASAVEKLPQRERRLFVGSTDNRAMLADYLIDFRTRLRGQLESAFPTLATRRSIVVTLLILRDGTVRDVELDRSSGDSGVDKKVLSALKALGQLQVLPTAASEAVDVLGVTVKLPIA